MLADIETHAGLKVNYDKSCIQTFNGAEKFESSKNFIWDPGGINVLGINISGGTKKNYDRLLEKAQSVLNSWHN